MASMDLRRYCRTLALCSLALIALLLISPGVGTESASFGWWDAWRAKLGIEISADEILQKPLADWDDDGSISSEERDGFVGTALRIGFDQRLARSLNALQVGITLAICGATFQILFRNILATPYTLGIASGGSLGALLALKLGWQFALLGMSALAFSAFGGALAVVGLVLLLARGSRKLSSNELLLGGVTIGLFCSAMMMFVTSISSERETFFIVRWMMGSLDPVRTLAGASMLPFVVPAWVGMFCAGRALNQYRLGDDLALARGLNVARLQVVCVLLCSLATAAVVAQCGPIGFVGLVVPHAVSRLIGPDARLLLPMSGMLGGAFLIVCDWGSQIALPMVGWATGQQMESATLPIGVVTALIGVPIFLILLRTRPAQPAS